MSRNLGICVCPYVVPETGGIFIHDASIVVVFGSISSYIQGRKIMLENKTKQDDTYLDLESPLFGDARERRRSALEVEDPREETEQRGEPFWLKVLCCVVVFPIVRANGKCQCNGANIAWSIFPLVLLSV